MLEAKNLFKKFGDVLAVDNVSFTVPDNSIFGIIGRNGAGKTTTIRMLLNIYSLDKGEVFFQGQHINSEFKRRIGYLPEERGLYKKMKVMDTILFFAGLKGMKKPEAISKAEYYLDRFELSDRKNSKLGDLSKGNQQKIQFIITVIHEPDVIILDEPFAGLDPVNMNIFKELILELKQKGKIILFSTHMMDVAEKMCDHILMIDHGRSILSGKLSEIKNEYARKNIKLGYEGDISFLKNHEMVDSVNDFGQTTGVRLKENMDSQEFLKLLIEKKVRVNQYTAGDISLHEIFIELADKGQETNGGNHVQ